MLRAPAAERNKNAILDVLRRFLKSGNKVLEIASGTGQHITYFGESLPSVTFQPSECDSRMLHSIVGFIEEHKLPNVRVPLYINVAKRFDQWALPGDYGPKTVDVVLNINMIHISSSRAVQGLFEAADNLLNDQNGLLITYGPYSIDGVISPKSNVDFDYGLRCQNADWGLRDTKHLETLATEANLHLAEKIEMPANNWMLIFSR
ncbi:unnamed protein product [Caenorhabditis bovis]|uniref:DUF938 domain-containing protein n=1 Tax=Caenorhabditis bovis TaxID=2654633 RepID=A0A8S1EA84_9PELO|nr:unnamed protein product [Caenorhabditis bovis]